MRTAQVCPECAKYQNSKCSLYEGPYLALLDIEPGDSMEVVLIKLNSWLATSVSPTSGAKYYAALLSQTGTSNPTNSILRNDIEAPNWVRIDVGTYSLTKTGAFVVGKTIPNKVQQYLDAVGNLFVITPVDENVVILRTYSAVDTTTLADGVLLAQYVKIEIYS